jgi:hypothetical protein
MIFTTSDSDAYLVFHWPNETSDERVKLVRVHISDGDIQIAQ